MAPVPSPQVFPTGPGRTIPGTVTVDRATLGIGSFTVKVAFCTVKPEVLVQPFLVTLFNVNVVLTGGVGTLHLVLEATPQMEFASKLPCGVALMVTERFVVVLLHPFELA